jgi:hypothetical protein
VSSNFLYIPNLAYVSANSMFYLDVICYDSGYEIPRTHGRHLSSSSIAGIQSSRMSRKMSRLSRWSLPFVRILDLEESFIGVSIIKSISEFYLATCLLVVSIFVISHVGLCKPRLAWGATNMRNDHSGMSFRTFTTIPSANYCMNSDWKYEKESPLWILAIWLYQDLRID